MKKKLFCVLLALVMVLSLCTFASAADYGVIYDGTGELNSQYLTWQGEELLPLLTEMFEVDLRVDVLADPVYDDPASAAEDLYLEYEYGYGEDGCGITLTIFLRETVDGVYRMVSEDDWYLYGVYLGDDAWDEGGILTLVYDAIAPYLGGDAWSGEDLTMTSTALSQAIDAMAQTLTDFCTNGEYTVTELLELTGYPVDEAMIADEPLTEAPAAEPVNENGVPSDEPEPDEEEEPARDDGAPQAVTYVFDLADLLTYNGWDALNQKADEITRRHSCGVYVVTVDSYEDYGSGDVYDVTTQIYNNEENGFGVGSGKDGILLLLSMEDRDWAMFVHGERAEYAFNATGQAKLEDVFLDDLADDNWYQGFEDYLDACDEYLTLAKSGKPVRESPVDGILCSIILSLLIALAVCMTQKAKMKTVHKQVEAGAYIAGELTLTDSFDQYTHTTETRRTIEKESSSSSSRSGGGGSGRSGKF